jgi:hypothetical protein
MSAYDSDRAFSDRYIPAIRRIVGPLLLTPAPFDLDTREATDLLVFTARDMRIAARIRRANKYMDRYGYEFTLRAKRDSGATTELSKVVDGWGDWLFYGFGDPSSGEVLNWWLVDLHAFRAALIRHTANGSILRYGSKDNGDGTYFKWFDVRSFPPRPPILVAGSRPLSCAGAA